MLLCALNLRIKSTVYLFNLNGINIRFNNLKEREMVKVMKKVSEDYVKNAEMVREIFPGAVVMDVTIDGGMKKLDPGYVWGGKKEKEDGKVVLVKDVIVVGRDKEKGLSLKGVIEGLKLFKRKGEIDEKWWKDEKFLEKERNCKSYGKLMGFDMGNESVSVEKGKEVFEKIYKEEVEKRFVNVIEGLRKEERVVLLLDYMEGDERNVIDHAEILKGLIEKEEKEILAA